MCVLQVLNLVCLEHQVRNYSYSMLVLLRVMHQARWMAGAAKGDSSLQTKMISGVANGILQENAKRAKGKKAPLTFEEARTEMIRVLTVEMRFVVDQVDLYSGDGYGAGCSGLGKCYKDDPEVRKEAREAEREEPREHVREEKAKKRSAYDKAGHEEFKRKEKQTCRDFNVKPEGCTHDPCKFKHKCSQKVGQGRICWEAHKKVNCPHKK